MWNTPSDRDCYDPLGLDCDDGEPEICGDCGARWDRGEACEDWCETNRPVPESVAVSEQEVNLFEEAAQAAHK
jgi:hypothetical protein